MTGKNAAGKGGEKTPPREDRLKKALKANLARRKQQARARSGAGSKDAPKG